jgi:hypothetical protein
MSSELDQELSNGVSELAGPDKTLKNAVFRVERADGLSTWSGATGTTSQHNATR